MTANERLVVGVDGSPAGNAALGYAVEEAVRHGDDLELVHVLPPVGSSPHETITPERLVGVGRAVLDAAVGRVAGMVEEKRIITTLTQGRRVASLVEIAAGARAVVLGHDSRSTLERLATASTVVGMASRSPVPVVAVGPDWSPGAQHGLVVIGVKWPEDCHTLLRRGFGAAYERKAALGVVYAWESPAGYYGLALSPTEIEAHSSRVRRLLEASIGLLAEEYPEVGHQVRVVHGQAARVLESASADADLLILTRRSHPWHGDLGGTSRALLREAHCPVEIVPQAG